MQRRSGLTLTELVIATAIVAVVASVAVPAAVSRRIDANETSAVSALEMIQSAQVAFQAAGYADVDNDGIGEYGLMRELSGAMGVRASAAAATIGSRVDPPLLPPEFRRFTRHGEIERAGYLFQIVLPGAAGLGMLGPRRGIGALVATIDSDLAATAWGCYAWPKRYGRTGFRTFFTNQTRDIVATEAREHSGGGAFKYANAGSAFVAGWYPAAITGQLAIGTVGRDGNFWRLVTPRAEEGRAAGFRSSAFLGSVRVERHNRLTATDETFTLRVHELSPSHAYRILLTGPGREPLQVARLRADAQGRAIFRFDRRQQRQSGVDPSLDEFAGGRLDLEWFNSDYTLYPGLLFPAIDVPDPKAPFMSTPDSNEANAIAALRDIAAAQMHFQASGVCDVDVDQVGEFGLFRELSGALGVRIISNASMQGAVIDPPALSRAFNNFNGDSDIVRFGYLFHMILPSSAGIGDIERAAGALAASLDADLAETTWCCYAWPVKYGSTGGRAFFVNQSGSIVATDSIQYSANGAFEARNAGAAFEHGGPLTNITGQVATGTRGRDGNLWRLVPDRPADHEFTVRGTLASPTGDSSLGGTFSLTSRQTRNDDLGSAEVTLTGVRTASHLLLALSDATGESGHTPRSVVRVDGGLRLSFDPVLDASRFGGGTIELRDGATVLLRGDIPTFTTVLGPHVPNSTAVFHATGWLDAAPHQLPKRGTFDLRVTNAPGGTRRELAISLRTHDRLAGPVTVTSIDTLGAATPLGTIVLRGRDGAGTLRLDSDLGDVLPIDGPGGVSGARIEIRDEFGTLLVSGALPSID